MTIKGGIISKMVQPESKKGRGSFSSVLSRSGGLTLGFTETPFFLHQNKSFEVSPMCTQLCADINLYVWRWGVKSELLGGWLPGVFGNQPLLVYCLPEICERLETVTSFLAAECFSYLTASFSIAFGGQESTNILKLRNPSWERYHQNCLLKQLTNQHIRR